MTTNSCERIRNAAIVNLSILLGALNPAVRGVGSEPSRETVDVCCRVIDSTGTPVQEAVVRIAVPCVTQGTGNPAVHVGRTDDQGLCWLSVPLDGNKTLTIDAVKPGYRSANATRASRAPWSRSLDHAVSPNETLQVTLTLEPGIYVSGAIVDPDGEPVIGATVQAILHRGSGRSSSDITQTDDLGRFELFDCSPESENYRTSLVISHPQFTTHTLTNVYAIKPAEREQLRIALDPGRSIHGRVFDSNGIPVAFAEVIAVGNRNPTLRKNTVTRRDGRFSLFGIVQQESRLLVRAFHLNEHLSKTITLNVDLHDIELRLIPIEFKVPLDVIEVFGLRLATITPPVRDAYFMERDAYGVIVLSVGEGAARLGIDCLHAGDRLWAIGAFPVPIGSVEDFVERLVDRNQDDEDAKTVFIGCPHGGIDISYGHVLKLTAKDVEQLHVIAAQNNTPPPIERPRPGFLGVVIAAESVGDVEAGTVVDVIPDSPAAHAGIQINKDIIVSAAGIPIRDPRHLREIVLSRSPGDVLVIGLRRGRHSHHDELEIPIVLGPNR